MLNENKYQAEAKRREFITASDRIEKAFAVLNEQINHTGETFKPVIKEMPCSPEKENVKKEAYSEFDKLISRIEDATYNAASRLRSYCEKSAV